MLKSVEAGKRKSMITVNSLMPKLFYVVSKDHTYVYKSGKRCNVFVRLPGKSIASPVKKAKERYAELYTQERVKALRVFDSLMAIKQRKEVQEQRRSQGVKSLDDLFGVVKTTNVSNKLVDRLKKASNKGNK